MRKFPYITVGSVLEKLSEEGLPITRATYYRLEKRLNLPVGKKTSGALQWRVYTKEELETIVAGIKAEYNM
jgi:hypothetical protein